MAVRVYACRIGDKYGSEYEENIRQKIPNIEIMHDGPFTLQWNKINFFNLGSENKWQKYLNDDEVKYITNKLSTEMKELGYI